MLFWGHSPHLPTALTSQCPPKTFGPSVSQAESTRPLYETAERMAAAGTMENVSPRVAMGEDDTSYREPANYEVSADRTSPR